MQITTIGLDIAKNVLQVHGIDATEKVVVRKQLRRSQVLAFFKALPPCTGAVGRISAGAAEHISAEHISAEGISVGRILVGRILVGRILVGRILAASMPATVSAAMALAVVLPATASPGTVWPATILAPATTRRGLALSIMGSPLTATRLGLCNNAFVTRNGLNGAKASRIAAHNFAHNQFARNFHGLHNFNSNGFNRNTFGCQAGWNQWGGNFYGAGWNNWGGGWGGWAGPVFWPFLWGDIFSFAFWPYGYYDPFWAYGPAFFLDSLFAPGPYFGPTYGYGPDYHDYEGLYGYARSPNIYYGSAGGGPYLDKADQHAVARTNTQAMESCGRLAPGVTDLPIAQINRTVRPTGDQITALDDLNAALSKASDIVATSCPKDVPLTPVGRLDAAEKRLGAIIEAIDSVRSPLANFYDPLSDEQKHRFDAMGRSGRAGAPAAISPRSAASRREAPPTCRSSASSRWCSPPDSSRTPSMLSRRHRKMPLTSCRHHARR